MSHFEITRDYYDGDQSIAEQELYAEGVVDQELGEPNEPTFEFDWMSVAYIEGRRDHMAVLAGNVAPFMREGVNDDI